MVVVVLLGDAVLRGNGSVAIRIGGVGALVVWAAWMLLVRPSIRVRPDRAVVVNVGRITEVPWSRIVDIRRRLQLVLELDDGRRVEAWGSPFPRRRMVGRTPKTEVDDPALSVLRGAWMSVDPTSAVALPVTRRVDLTALLIGGLAVAVLAASLAVPR
jgi:hypothetical protein